MKNLLFYAILVGFAVLNIFGSCEEDLKKKNKMIKNSKQFLNTYKVYDNIDSSYTGITVYVGEVGGHKYRYHLFEGKNKSQMEIEHVKEECKKCKHKQ